MKKSKRFIAALALFATFFACFSQFVLPDSYAALNSEYVAMEKKINQTKDKLAKLGDSLKDIEEQIEKNKTEQNRLIGEKELLDGRIALYQEEIEVTEEYIRDLEDQIGIKEQLIAENERTEAVKYELFKERVRAMHEDGTVSYLGVLLGAEDFYDLLARVEIIERVVQYDDQVVKDLIEVREGIIAAKEELESDKADKDEVMAGLTKLKSQLDEEQAANIAFINNLKNEEKKSRDAYEAAENAQDRLRDQIRRDTAELANISKYVGGSFVWPIPGYYTVTSPYGMRMHPVLHQYKLHTGTDIGAPKGTKIVAMNSGTVLYSGYNSGYGNYVTINHGGGYVTLYAHMSKRAVEKGDKIKQGQLIGYVGSTGYSTGPHLHFEVIIDGKTNDPMKYFK